VRPLKNQKIDLNVDYPCPCRKKGNLLPIALTEAFGCDRCQQIFVVRENEQEIEQLSPSYPYKRAWRWNGKHWSLAGSDWTKGYISILLGLGAIASIIVFPYILKFLNAEHLLLWAVIILVGIVGIGYLVYRRA
jgi:hypothetical protein